MLSKPISERWLQREPHYSRIMAAGQLALFQKGALSSDWSVVEEREANQRQAKFRKAVRDPDTVESLADRLEMCHQMV